MELRIKSLAVKNCGPLRDVEIDFTSDGKTPRPVTIIGGANGSGKTTALELIFALIHFGLLHYRSATENIRFLMPEEMDILGRSESARVTLLSDGSKFVIPWQTSPARAGNNKIDPTPVQAEKVDYFHKILQEQQKKPKQPLFVSTTASSSALDVPSVLYFPDYRRLKPIEGRQITQEDLAYQWVYKYEVVSSFEGSLDSYLVWLDYAHPQIFAEVKQFINQFVLIDKAITAVNRPNLTTMVELSDGQAHPLHQLSSGEQNLLIIMLELRRRLLPGSIVLIDKIENSLHPAFQHRLAESLLKLQAQIPFQLIATTHAPSFMEIFGPESTLLLTEF